MVPKLDSEAAVRQYAEDELRRSIRARHPELEVKFMDEIRSGDMSEFDPKGVWWRITPPQGDLPKWYTLQARVDEGEFLIWYGYSTHGPLETKEIMRSAVHVRFRDLLFASQEFPEVYREQFTLGAVLEWMLRAPDAYPMNVLAFT